MAALARSLGLVLTPDPAEADVILVNTCGFIQEATEESIEAVLDLGLFKQGRCETLVLAGCLSQRYPEELPKELAEVDHFIGAGDLPRLEQVLLGNASRSAVRPPGGIPHSSHLAREVSGSGHSVYLKIAEGCDRPCAFCTIPAIRGPLRSRSIPSLLQEAETLWSQGAQELVLVAQDTTAWGRDLQPTAHLASLLEALDSQLRGLRWIRLLYAYPSAVDQILVEALAGLPRVVPYLDLPIQHIDDEVLRRMKRGYSGTRVRQTIDRLRQAVPHIALRSTLLCGHPGETPAAHQALLDFVKETRLDHLGVFPFSAEEGTDAATQPGPVDAPLTRQRAEEVMALQQDISRDKLQRMQGELLEVMVDGPSPESEHLLQGRHAGQAPEVDGVVVLTDGIAAPGELVRARITDSGDYDLVASLDTDGSGFE